MNRRRTWQLSVAVLLVPLACLAAVNGFLNAVLPQLINGRQDRVHVAYTAAWMIVPGHVHIRGLRIRAEGQREQWHLSAERASATVALAELATRTFHASAVRGSGVSLRHRRHRETSSGGHPRWTVQLDDIQVDDIEEIVAGDYRITGRATATADLSIAAHLVDATGTLSFLDAAIDVDESPLARRFMGEVGFAIEDMDRRDLAHDRIQALSGHATLEADVQDMRFLDFYLTALPWLTVSGIGHATVDVDIAHGRVEPGSTVAASFPELVVRVLTHDVTGTGELRAAVAHIAASPPELRVDIDFEDFAIAPRGSPQTLVEGQGFHVGLQSPDIAVDRLLTTVSAVLDLPASRIPDLAAFNTILPKGTGLELLSGVGTAHGRLYTTGESNQASGEFYVDGEELVVQLDTLFITADLALHAKLAEAQLDAGRYDLSGTRLSLTHVGLIDRARPENSDGERLWWGTVAVDEGTVLVGAPIYLDAQLHLESSDSAPFVAAFAQKETLPRWAQEALSVKDVSGEARLQLGLTTFVVAPCEIRGGSHYQINLDYRRDGPSSHGVLLARAGPFSLGVELGADRSALQLIGAAKWFEQHTRGLLP